MDPYRRADDAPVELLHQGRVEGGLDRGVAERVGEVADRRRPLPPDQRQRHQRQCQRPAAGQHQRQHGPAEERPEPGDVAADGVVEGEQADRRERVEANPPAQRPLVARDQDQGGRGEYRHV